MNIQEFKTSKGEFASILLPDLFVNAIISMGYLICKVHNTGNWISTDDIENPIKCIEYIQKHKPEKDYKDVAIKLPTGEWVKIGVQTEITEEQAKDIVPCELIGGIGGIGMQWLYPDYTASMNDGFESALESFNSLMQSLEMYSENPYTHPSKLYTIGYNKNKQLWKEAQSRTGKWLIIQKIK